MDIGEGIAIKRDDLFVSAGHSLFDWLFRLSQSAIVVLNDQRSKVLTVEKKSDEIITLDFDYEILGKKFFDWRYSKKEWWELNTYETLMFIECCHAAHYYLSIQNYNIGDNRDNINWLYNCVIRDLGLNEQTIFTADT